MKRLLAFLAVAAVIVAPKGADAASLIFNGSGVKQVLPGTNVTITGNPAYPVINASGGGGGVGGGSINTTTTETTAPSTPSAGNISTWVSSTDHRLHDKNSSGTVGTTVVPSTAGANQFCSAVSNAGVMSYAQPAFSNLSGSLTCAQEPAMSGGDIGSSAGTCALTINANAVTNAKAAQMGANTIKGNNTGSTANAADLTATQATAMLNQFTSSLQGLAPASGGGTTNFLRADGTWNAPSGSSSINATTSETAAPASPSAGSVSTWVDSTDHRLHDKNSSGAVGTTVVSSTASSHQYATAVSAAGVMTYAQPVISDITAFTSSALAGQISDETGTGLACFATNPTLTGATMAGRLNLGDNPIDCGSGYHNDGNKTGASPALADFSATCNNHTWTLTGNVTGTPTWTIGGAKHFEVWVCQDGTGSRTMVWPSSPTLIWTGSGSAPTLSTTASACDVIDFSYNGTTIVGQAVASGSGGGITAGTGDATFSGSGSVVVTNVNAPDGFTQAGKIIATAIAAPATPAAGKGSFYVDSTSKNICLKDDAGTVKHGVQTNTGTSNQWVSAIADNGAVTTTQPGVSNLSSSTSSALATVLSDETGSGAAVFATSPTLVTPTLGVASATSLAMGNGAVTAVKAVTYNGVVDNGNEGGAAPALLTWSAGNSQKITLTSNITGTPTWTLPSGTQYLQLDICQDATGGRTMTWPTVTWDGGSAPTLVSTASACTRISLRYDGTTVTGTSGALYGKVGSTLAQFAATTSAAFFGVISDEQGSGAVVGATSPTLTTPNIGAATATSIAMGNGNITAAKAVYLNGKVAGGNKTGAAVALFDWTQGPYQTITLTGNVTGTSTCTAPSGTILGLTALVLQDATGSRTVASWCPGTKWVGGAAPTLTTTASRADRITCDYDGTNYWCKADLNVN